MEKEKYSTLIAILFVVMILGLSFITYHYRLDAKFGKMQKASDKGFYSVKRKPIAANLIVMAGIDDKFLRMKLNIPLKSIYQKRELMLSFPRIQHLMLMSVSEPNMIEWIEHRNFRAIKKHALRLVNIYSTVKVKRLYMENFFYN